MKIQLRSYLKLSLSAIITLLAAQSAFTQGVNVDAKPYPKVTDERLEHPAAGDWLMYRRTYDGSGYSPLNQITPSNIGSDRKSTRLNSSHQIISYAVFCLKKKTTKAS